jgi:hypothetical protein
LRLTVIRLLLDDAGSSAVAARSPFADGILAHVGAPHGQQALRNHYFDLT